MYTRSIQVSEHLQINDGGTINGGLNMSQGSLLNINTTSGFNLDRNKFSGTGFAITKTNGGTLSIGQSFSAHSGTFTQEDGTTLITAPTFNSLHTINGGTLIFDSGIGLSANTKVNLGTNAGLVISANDNLNFVANFLSGSGLLNKTCNAALSILGDNSGYSGIYTQSGGKTVLTASSFGGAHNINNGSVLEFGTNSSFTSGSSYAINAATVTISATNALTLSGQVSGNAGALINKTGSGVLTISGNNSGYEGRFLQSAGTTIINSSAFN